MSEKVLKHLPELVRASLEGDKRTVELSTLTIIRKIKKEYPIISNELAKILSTYSAGAPLTRSLGVESPPVDKDSFLSLVKITDNTTFEEQIVLEENVEEKINRFLKERSLMEKLISNGIKPPNSLLLFGPPGVGKTMLSKYISHKLSLPLITLDLASSISSYLGKTGQNIKKVLDYAKLKPSILLLDEFDAIAKRRDDPTDLGELKRIVNVLLKELEEWPSHSVLIGATNHPEFLDKAIWRRFDLKIEMGLPNEELRYKLWTKHLSRDIINLPDDFIWVISKTLDNVSASDIKQISERVLRQVILDEDDPKKILIKTIKEIYPDVPSNFNKQMIKLIKEYYGNKLSQAKIAEIMGISPSTVNHHLKSLTQ
ncbi:ATP-binding protein [Parageobacillus sp. KH3-4]|uniref:ATP-binding protein n=1 Tax=Parageobacillus sp. KH3-4 TaxID=2916802 RepID=UPI000E3746E2|nr:ATP-binding protein [Parageobacillus sp. KH3-4]REK59010.1 MAG: ATP-binding protein [Geobacillus sp.]BDG48819.1 ATPase AAA [Parageobacillus sp. KH3-4]